MKNKCNKIFRLFMLWFRYNIVQIFVVILAFILALYIFLTSSEYNNTHITLENQQNDVFDVINLSVNDAINKPVNLSLKEKQEIKDDIVVKEDKDDVKVEKYYYDIPLSEELQDYIFITSSEYNVPVELILALIHTESNFNSKIISSTNDYGLCQINKINHEWLSKELGVTDFLDEKQNILCGIFMLSEKLKITNNDVNLALMCYNCGDTGAKKLWKKGIYSTIYSEKVAEKYNYYVSIK